MLSPLHIGRLHHHFVVTQFEVLVEKRDAEPRESAVPLQDLTYFLKAGGVGIVDGLYVNNFGRGFSTASLRGVEPRGRRQKSLDHPLLESATPGRTSAEDYANVTGKSTAISVREGAEQLIGAGDGWSLHQPNTGAGRGPEVRTANDRAADVSAEHRCARSSGNRRTALPAG